MGRMEVVWARNRRQVVVVKSVLRKLVVVVEEVDHPFIGLDRALPRRGSMGTNQPSEVAYSTSLLSSWHIPHP
jgi:hypothetical protein